MSWEGVISLWVTVLVMVGLVFLGGRSQYKESQEAEGDSKE